MASNRLNGHVFSSFQLGRIGTSVLNCSVASKKEHLLYFARLCFTLVPAVAVLDGFIKEWFFLEILFPNDAGTGRYIRQELLCKKL